MYKEIKCLNIIFGVDDDVIKLETEHINTYKSVIGSAVRQLLEVVSPETLELPKERIEIYTYGINGMMNDFKETLTSEEINTLKSNVRDLVECYEPTEDFTEHDIDMLTAVFNVLPVWLTESVRDTIYGTDVDKINFISVVSMDAKLIDKLKRLPNDPCDEFKVPVLSRLLSACAEEIVNNHQEYISRVDGVIESFDVVIRKEYQN